MVTTHREAIAFADERVSAGDVLGAMRHIEDLLRNQTQYDVQLALTSTFTNPPESVLAEINAFILGCEKKFDIQAVYIEMNGFEINWGLWFFDLFGYAQAQPPTADLDWLSDWQSPDWPFVDLTGMERLQKEYPEFNALRRTDKSFDPTFWLTNALVLLKFVDLIQRTLRSGPLVKPIPVLATAHDYTALVRFEPI